MEHDGVGDMEIDVYHLSDNDLAQKLRQMGANIGPITDTTRSVYQNKLQRWLLHGPSTPTGMLDLERPVDITARSKNSAESNGISARSVDNKHIDVSATSMPTKITGRDEASLAAAAVGPHHNHEASPVLRMSRSDVNAQGTPYSMTAAECGSESLSDTSRGWFGNETPAQPMMQKSHNMKANSVIGNQPLVTPNDIDIVDRAVGIPNVSSSTPASALAGSSRDEYMLRRRISNVVTPRPGLSEYRSSFDGSSHSLDFEHYRSLLQSSTQPSSSPVPASSAAAAATAEPRRFCDTNTLIICGTVGILLLLFVYAVVRNMEPAYLNPVAH